jgi:succinate dehydrogenase/fumarate reductase cytochrome b subunit
VKINMAMPSRTHHRISAFVLLAFLCVHVTNHLLAVFGVEAHIAFMEVARRVYRAPMVEPVILLAAAFQVMSGLWFVARGWRTRHGAVAWLQAISGLYLAFFLLIHVGAVLHGRLVLALDTNFHFAAAGMHVPPFQFFFVPYYFLSLLALGAHLGCAIYWRLAAASDRMRRAAIVLPVLAGSAAAAVIVLSLAGKLYPVDVPARYKASFALQTR